MQTTEQMTESKTDTIIDFILKVKPATIKLFLENIAQPITIDEKDYLGNRNNLLEIQKIGDKPSGYYLINPDKVVYIECLSEENNQ